MGILQSNLVDSYNKSMISFFEWDTRQQRPSFSLKNKKKDEHHYMTEQKYNKNEQMYDIYKINIWKRVVVV